MVVLIAARGFLQVVRRMISTSNERVKQPFSRNPQDERFVHQYFQKPDLFKPER